MAQKEISLAGTCIWAKKVDDFLKLLATFQNFFRRIATFSANLILNWAIFCKFVDF